MKISILITSYNKEKYIQHCIESCLIQKTKDLEIVLFDNFSSDQTDLILNKYKNKINIFKSKKISNYPAINQIDLLIKAFHKCSGEIICLLDADDFYSKNKISEVKNFFMNNKSKNVLFDLPLIQKANCLKKFNNKNKLNKNIWPTIIPTSSISIRRKLFLKFLNVKLFVDYNLLEVDFRINVYSRLVDRNFKILKKSLNIYRQVEDGIMSSCKKFSFCWWSKRLQAHYFMSKFVKNKKTNNFLFDFDFIFTKFVVVLFNYFKKK